MKSLHLDVKIIGRSAGQSAVASAAYRSGQKLHDERAEKTFDYTRKEQILHSEIMAPENAPAWVGDREQLWNRVEASERYKNAQLARDIIAALPRDLSHDQQVGLVRDFVQENFVSKGMVADFSIHESDARDGGKNPHAHIMLTMRELDGDNFNAKKNRAWNDHANVPVWRDAWAEHCNRYLAEAGSSEEVITRSYAELGIDKIPQQKEGSQVAALERQGVETAIGDYNREVIHDNGLAEIAASYLEPEPARWDEAESFAGERAGMVSQLATQEARDDAALGGYLVAGLQRTWAASAEMITRVGEFFADTWEAATNLYDRFTNWADRVEEPGRGMERERVLEHER